MIQLPRRSVTRFFIPLVDVLTLLFAAFLIMQAARPADDAEAAGPGEDLDPARKMREDKKEMENVRSELVRERQSLDELRKERRGTLHQRLGIRVLEIDNDSGKLFQFSAGRTEIKNREDALKMIQQHKQELAGRELYYVILLPRSEKNVDAGQIDNYRRWFAGEPHHFENPHGDR